MRRTIASKFIIAASAATLSVGAVGCGNGGTTANPDGGATTQDLATAGGGDMAKAGPDMAVAAVTGTKVATGNQYILQGITTDDQIIAADESKAGTLVSIPLAGGKPSTIDAQASGWAIRGQVVSTFEGATQANPVGSQFIWAKGTAVNVSQASAGVYDASPDGKWVFYSDNAVSDGSAADLYVAKVDGTGAIKIGTQISTAAPCSAYGRFNSAGQLVLAYCDGSTVSDAGTGDGADPVLDGGTVTTTPKLVVIDPATGKSTTLGDTNAGWYDLDSTGTQVFSADANNVGYIYSTTGGAAKKVDSDVAVGEGYFTPDGKMVVYVTNGGALKSYSPTAPLPTTLVAKSVTHIPRWFVAVAYYTDYPAISPDGKWVMYATTAVDPMSGNSDLNLASTTTPGTPVVLSSDPMSAIFGDPFTGDSSQAVFYTNVVQVTASALAGKLVVQPVAAGGTPTQIAKNVWVSYVSSGNVLVFNDNYKSDKYNGRADLRVIDVTSPTATSTLLAVQTEADIYLSTKKDKVVFSLELPVSQAGVYVAPVKP